MAEKDAGDPTQTDAFQRVIRHFVTTPHRPHGSMRSEDKRTGADKASPDRKRGRAAKAPAAS
jgi:hypothetical protein